MFELNIVNKVDEAHKNKLTTSLYGGTFTEHLFVLKNVEIKLRL